MKLELTKGYFTEIDDELPEHLEWIKLVKWYAHKSRCGIYARRTVRINGKKKNVFLHRVLMKTRKDLQVNHINGNTLDNRIENLENVSGKTNIRLYHQLRKEKK